MADWAPVSGQDNHCLRLVYMFKKRVGGWVVEMENEASKMENVFFITLLPVPAQQMPKAMAAPHRTWGL